MSETWECHNEKLMLKLVDEDWNLNVFNILVYDEYFDVKGLDLFDYHSWTSITE